jgi:hypothetical protein
MSPQDTDSYRHRTAEVTRYVKPLLKDNSLTAIEEADDRFPAIPKDSLVSPIFVLC